MSLLIDLLFLFAAFGLSFILYPLWISFIYKFQIQEDARHVSKIGTPTMGGFVFVLVVSLLTFLFNQSRTQTLFPVFIATLAGLLGMLEDFTKVYIKSGLPGFFEYHFGFISKLFSKTKKLPLISHFVEFWRVVGSSNDSGIQTHQKFLIQALIGGFIAYWTYFKLGWDYLWFPLLGNVHIGWLYPIFIFIFFIVVLNFVAFTDGLDGLAGGLSIFVFITFWVLSSTFDYNSLSSFCATFIGALLPFLYFNVYPARVFMGNVGSYVLGAVMAVLSVILHRELAFLIIGFVFLVDGLSSPLQSWSVKLTKKRLFRMAPMHHHFELLGWPETKVTLRFWIFGMVFGLLGLFISLL